MTTSGSASVNIRELAKSYKSGIVVRRWAGAWVDFSVLALILIIPDWILGNELYQRTLVLWLALLILYFPLTEGLTGRSIGKVVTGTQVVTADCRHPGIRKAVIRTVVRLLEVNPLLLGGLPAGVVVLASSYRQRLGDMAAGTYVVLTRDLDPRTP